MNQLNVLTMPADAWLEALVETSLRLSLVLLAAGGIAIVLRRSSANLRHLVWALALAGGLLLPLGASYLPAVNLPLPAPLLGLAASDIAVDERLADSPVSTPVGAGAEEDAAGPATRPLVAAATRSGSGIDQTARLHPRVAPSWPQLLAGLWIAGMVVLVVRIGLGVVATRRLGRRAAPPDAEWQRLAVELARRIGLTRPVRVLSSPRTVVPMTWGWLRPVVLVPDAGAVWSAARKRVVLLHELNHVKRHDCASQLVAHVACAVYWFNPLVWLAARALRVEREHACDEAVVRDGTQASSYADHLLEIARAQRDSGWSSLAAVAMARRSELEGRLLSILDAPQRRRPSRRTALALGAVMTGVILTLTAVTPTMRAAAPVEAVALAAFGAGQQEPVPESPQILSAGEVGVRELELRAELEAVSQDSPRREQVEQAEVEVRELERRLEQARERTGRNVRIQEREIERVIERAERAAERALAGIDPAEFDRSVDRMRIAEQVRERLSIELDLNGMRGRVQGVTRPLDPRVVELFVESLADDDAQVRERAAWGLGRNRVEAGLDPLANALRDENAEVRERAAWALGMIRADAAVGPLSGLLDDAEADVAEQAAWALGMIRSPTAVNPLVEALDAAEPDVRVQAAWALGMIRSPSAVPGLGAALDDSEVTVRAEVVEALGRIRDTTAVEPLVAALRDSEPRVRREAAEALGRIRDAAAVDGLVAALGDDEPAVVEHAAEPLGMIRDARAVGGLVGALQHEDPDVSEEAAEALGRIRSDEAVDGLIAALRNAQGEVAEEIVQALSRIGGDRALDALIEMTGDASPAVRKAVIEALSGRRWSRNANPNPDPNPSPNPRPGR